MFVDFEKMGPDGVRKGLLANAFSLKVRASAKEYLELKRQETEELLAVRADKRNQLGLLLKGVGLGLTALGIGAAFLAAWLF